MNKCTCIGQIVIVQESMSGCVWCWLFSRHQIFKLENNRLNSRMIPCLTPWIWVIPIRFRQSPVLNNNKKPMTHFSIISEEVYYNVILLQTGIVRAIFLHESDLVKKSEIYICMNRTTEQISKFLSLEYETEPLNPPVTCDEDPISDLGHIVTKQIGGSRSTA